MDSNFLDGVIESILFVSGEPVKVARIAAVLAVSDAEIEDAAKRIADKLAFERRGIRLVQLEASLQLCSSPEYADYVRLALESRKPPELSAAALEVLSIIAYFQPVTKAYIEQIRGVDSSYTVGLLADKGFVEACGRLAVAGRPMIYKTTYAFLRTFGMSSLSELPELPHIEATDAGGKESIQKAIMELRAREESASNSDAAGNQADVPSEISKSGSEVFAENSTKVSPETFAIKE